MSIDNNKNHFEEDFFDEECLQQKENMSDFKSADDLSNRSKDLSSDKYTNAKTKGVNYIQNYKNNFKNTGYSELQKKKVTLNNYITNNNTNSRIIQESLAGLHTINYEQTTNPERDSVRESSHSPVKQKLVDALNNIDNIFVKITKKDNKKIENYQVRRTSNFREKTKNSLTSLVNIVSNQASANNIITDVTEVNNNALPNIEGSNINNLKTNPISSNNITGKIKLIQRNLNISQNENKSSDNVSENNNETSDEAFKNSRNISTNLELNSKSMNDKANNTSQAKHIYNNNESNLLNNVYKRPPRNKRDISQDSIDIKSAVSNRDLAENIESNTKAIFSAKNLNSKGINIRNKEDLDHNLIESTKNLDNLSTSSFAKTPNKKACLVKENKLQMSSSTITENQRSINNNLAFIYDESIKDHESEEKEINDNSFNKRFLEIIKTNTEEKITLKSDIPIAFACKISNEILTEMKNEGDKEICELINKNKELTQKNHELTKENAILKENFLKASMTSNNEKCVSDMTNTIKDLQKYILKLEKENVVLKNEFINNIKTKNGMIKKFNEDLCDYQKITKTFSEKYTEFENNSKENFE